MIFANYDFVEAKIDSYAGNSAYKDKYKPGVSKHCILFGVDATPTKTIKLTASQTLRSSAYRFDDFTNDGNDKQPIYRSTNLGASYKIGNYELFAKATNIFGAKNGIVTKQGSTAAYYPTEFEAVYTIGFSAKF